MISLGSAHDTSSRKRDPSTTERSERMRADTGRACGPRRGDTRPSVVPLRHEFRVVFPSVLTPPSPPPPSPSLSYPLLPLVRVLARTEPSIRFGLLCYYLTAYVYTNTRLSLPLPLPLRLRLRLRLLLLFLFLVLLLPPCLPPPRPPSFILFLLFLPSAFKVVCVLRYARDITRFFLEAHCDK